ncbi:hypothetical protein AT5A_24645 [Agrobacterium tumefaciens 5A]|nr:hypothetical protein AT5A_24645 [Agrobacterium tumefaciens 5A]
MMRFPGNTIICHLPVDSDLRPVLFHLYKSLERSKDRGLYTLLPPDSWHMTVFEGTVDAKREPGFWPSDLSLEATLAECTSHLERKLDRFDIQDSGDFVMQVSGWLPLVDGIGLTLRSKELGQEIRLRDLRDRLSQALQIRHPEHERYVFHLSIAYLLRELTPSQLDVLSETLQQAITSMPSSFTLGTPEYCEFDDMFEFRRRSYLRKLDTP